MKKGGFTIVEMLMVIGILAILIGIVGTAASSAVKQGRERRADAMKQALQAGINAYYAENGEWPPKGGKISQLADDGATDKNKIVYELSGTEADKAFQEVVSKSVQSGHAPYLDVSGLYVCKSPNAERPSGVDFRTAFTSGKRESGGRQSAMSISAMSFGYPDRETGYFRRYRIKYNTQTDSVSVLKQGE